MIPDHVKKYFWGDDLEDLSWDRHKAYITKTILQKGDLEAVKWLFNNADRQFIKNIVETKKLDPKSQNYWKIYFT